MPYPNSNDRSDDAHIPVLLEPTLQYLQPRAGESYLDVTAGYGGHAAAVLEHTQAPEKAVLVDRDERAVSALHDRFWVSSGDGLMGPRPTIRHQDFYQASRELAADGAKVGNIDMILADLGVSSPHLNHADRGFSLAQEGPLDMRMDRRQALTAADIVNSYDADELADVLWRYGEEPKSRQIARLIVQYRRTHTARLATTTQLAQLVAKAWPGHSKVHPATRTFQALRIVVNDELRLVEQSLPLWVELLAPGGRLVVISFHSLEDRLVKQMFAAVGSYRGDTYDATLRVLTKHPVTASDAELATNPRARSAKLRAALKITKI